MIAGKDPSATTRVEVSKKKKDRDSYKLNRSLYPAKCAAGLDGRMIVEAGQLSKDRGAAGQSCQRGRPSNQASLGGGNGSPSRPAALTKNIKPRIRRRGK